MNPLEHFLYRTIRYLHEHDFRDVLDLYPYFEDLDLNNWETLLDRQQGRPVTTTLFQSEQLRLLIICWERGQESSVHGHRAGGGLIKILAGELHETRFDPEDCSITGEFDYGPGDVTYIHDMIAWHRVRNPGNGRAFSLHLYTRRAEA